MAQSSTQYDRKVSHKPAVIKDLFTPEVHEQLKQFVEAQGKVLGEVDSTQFHRRQAHNVPFFQHIHEQLVDVASEYFGEPVKASYSFLSMYAAGGVCPPHTDRPQCKWTFDYCISQKRPWPIYVSDPVERVEGKDPHPALEDAKFHKYLLEENDALLFSGSHTWHYRDTIDPDNFCNLVFFHFVPVGFKGSLE